MQQSVMISRNLTGNDYPDYVTLKDMIALLKMKIPNQKGIFHWEMNGETLSMISNNICLQSDIKFRRTYEVFLHDCNIEINEDLHKGTVMLIFDIKDTISLPLEPSIVKQVSKLILDFCKSSCVSPDIILDFVKSEIQEELSK